MVDEKQRFIASLAKSWQLLTMSQIVEILAEQEANRGPTVEQALLDLECATRDKVEQMQKLQDQVFRDHAKGFDLDALPEAGVTRELSCVACGKRADVEDYDPRDTYYCAHCKGLLVPLSGPTSELDETSRALPEIDTVPDPESSSRLPALNMLDATGEIVIATEDDDLDDPELERYDKLVTIQLGGASPAGGAAPPPATSGVAARTQTQRVTAPSSRLPAAPASKPSTAPATVPGPRPAARSDGEVAAARSTSPVPPAPTTPAPVAVAGTALPSAKPELPPIPPRRQAKAPMIVGLDDEPFSRKSGTGPSSARPPAAAPSAPPAGPVGAATAPTAPTAKPSAASPAPVAGAKATSGRATTCCGHALDTAWRFCPRCGRPAQPCSKCARALEREWRTCPYCATSVAP